METTGLVLQPVSVTAIAVPIILDNHFMISPYVIKPLQMRGVTTHSKALYGIVLNF